jgi:hypothetical protein
MVIGSAIAVLTGMDHSLLIAGVQMIRFGQNNVADEVALDFNLLNNHHHLLL